MRSGMGMGGLEEVSKRRRDVVESVNKDDSGILVYPYLRFVSLADPLNIESCECTHRISRSSQVKIELKV